MAHVLDPECLRNETDYRAALDELDALMLCDPDTPAGRRFDELTALIDGYEAKKLPAQRPQVAAGPAGHTITFEPRSSSSYRPPHNSR